MGFEWDEESKAGINFRKHGVRMPEAIAVFDDPHAIPIADDGSDPNEQRFVTLALVRPAGCSSLSARGVARTFGSSPRPAEAHERDEYETKP